MAGFYARKRYSGYRRGYRGRGKFVGRFRKSGLSRAPIRRVGFAARTFKKSRAITAELKTVDLDGNNFTFPQSFSSGAPAAFILNDIPLGSDIFNRIGRKVSLKSVMVRGQVNTTTTSSNQGTRVRLLLVWDRQPNGAGASGGDIAGILQNNQIANASTLASDYTYANASLTNRERYVILKDKVITIQPYLYSTGTLSVSNTGMSHSFMFYRKMNATTIYKNNGNTADPTGANISSGRLSLWAVSDTASILCQIQFNSRVRFTDA